MYDTRQSARRVLRHLAYDGDADVAVLLVSELVTDLVTRARCPRPSLTLRLDVNSAGELAISVTDKRPLRQAPRPSPGRHRHLLRVARCVGARLERTVQEGITTVRACLPNPKERP
ncbi:hypothetical protein [Streptomyces sp. NPDC088925]|uniref:hypothetical protein n=1 Tax=Streptomyces sp. NPDC088925 TaxID=3365914 RepID=UPI0038001749